MMDFLCRILKKDPQSREGIILSTSLLGIIANLIMAAAKVIVGLMASSVAIVADGANSATDAVTSVLTMVGTRLAEKHPDEKHPFGYGRIEYLTSLVVSILILFTGGEALIDSVRRIIHPQAMDVTAITMIILLASAVAKFLLGVYTIKRGEKADSGALVGVGKECRNDCFASLITVVSAVVFLAFNLNLDGYAGVIASLLIIKAGVETLTETVNELLGRKGEKELADKLYDEIRATEGIVGAADMMLHNYGPGAWSGSVNVEIDCKKTVADVYSLLHSLQLHIMHDYKVTMVFGVYAVDNGRDDMKQLRRCIADFVRNHSHVKSYHAVYVEPDTGKIYCDLIVDYKLKDWDELREEFRTYMESQYPARPVELTLETEYV